MGSFLELMLNEPAKIIVRSCAILIMKIRKPETLFPKIKDITLKGNIKIASRLHFNYSEPQSKAVIFGSETEGEAPSNAILVGKVEETHPGHSLYNYNLWLSTDFPSIIMIYGRRGTGKSYTMGTLAEGLISRGNNISISQSRYAILLIDTLGQFWQITFPPPKSEKQQLSDLANWGLKPNGYSNVQVFVPIGYNKYADNWMDFSITISDLDLEDWCGLLQVDRYADRIGQLMGQVYEKVLNDGYTHAERDPDTGNVVHQHQVQPKESYNLDDLIECLDFDLEINSKSQGYERATIRALRSRLADMRTWRVLSEHGTSIEEIFKAGLLTVINVSEADYSLKTLITGILTKKIFKARAEARAREEISRITNKPNEKPSIPPGWLFLDEAHNYCPESGIVSSKEWLIRYAKEGRSLGLGLVGTTQQPSALSTKLTSQINILICHGLAFSQDIAAVEARILNDMFEQIIINGEEIKTSILERVLRNLDRGEALVSSTGVNRVFLGRIRPRSAAHGGAPPKTV